MIPIGKAIKAVRRHRQLTQYQLAKKTKMPRSYVSRVEECTLTPGLAQIERFALAFDMETYKLIKFASTLDGPD